MKIKKEAPLIKETREKREKGKGYFIYKKIPEGQVGVVKSYGEEVLQKLEKIAPNIKRLQKLPAEGWRTKYIGQIKLKDNLLKFIIKQKDNPLKPTWSDSTPSEQRCFQSVLHEIAINLETRERYKEKYHEDLPLEKPVGFFIAKNGDRFTIHEFIKNLTPVPDDEIRQFVFANKITKRLKELNVWPKDFSQRHVRGQKVGKKTKFWIIDTEFWEKN